MSLCSGCATACEGLTGSMLSKCLLANSRPFLRWLINESFNRYFEALEEFGNCIREEGLGHCNKQMNMIIYSFSAIEIAYFSDAMWPEMHS